MRRMVEVFNGGRITTLFDPIERRMRCNRKERAALIAVDDYRLARRFAGPWPWGGLPGDLKRSAWQKRATPCRVSIQPRVRASGGVCRQPGAVRPQRNVRGKYSRRLLKRCCYANRVDYVPRSSV